MLAQATLTVDLEVIEHNARAVVSALAPIEVVGVAKVTCGDPFVAKAMLAGGVTALAESRLENLAGLRAAGITAPLWLLRATTPGLAEKTVQLADVSLESELEALRALDSAAALLGKRHSIVVMVDVGDLREGLWPDAVPAFLEAARTLEHIDIVGVGASLTCYGAIVPDPTNLGLLASVAAAAEEQLGHALWTSAGSSTSIEPLMTGALPGGAHDVRLGESIVLGVDPASRMPIPGVDLRQDALTLAAPVIECAIKPSLPLGTSAQDAFGGFPSFEDRGMRRRAICAVGRQDVAPEDLAPLDPRVQILGASSDHLVLDVHDLPVAPRIGDAIEFRPGYSATLRLFTSPYILKAHLNG
jgi:ornithine racemase